MCKECARGVKEMSKGRAKNMRGICKGCDRKACARDAQETCKGSARSHKGHTKDAQGMGRRHAADAEGACNRICTYDLNSTNCLPVQ